MYLCLLVFTERRVMGPSKRTHLNLSIRLVTKSLVQNIHPLPGPPLPSHRFPSLLSFGSRLRGNKSMYRISYSTMLINIKKDRRDRDVVHQKHYQELYPNIRGSASNLSTK
jgi:hypothetical protein